MSSSPEGVDKSVQKFQHFLFPQRFLAAKGVP